MKKGLSATISVILVLLIAISVTALVAMLLPRITFNIFNTESSFNQSYVRSRGCLNMEKNTIGKNVTIKNCGKIPLQDFKIYIDGKEEDLNIGNLNPQESVTISPLLPKIEGYHEYYTTANYAETSFMKFYVMLCDKYIYQTMIPYNITLNNTYYCLAENVNISGKTAINFSSGVQNSTLDCKGYNIDGNKTTLTYGVFLSGLDNFNIVMNCNVTRFYNGIHIYGWSSNNTIANNIANNNSFCGILFDYASNNIIMNNIANINDFFGLYLVDYSNNNTEINNTANSNYAGIDLQITSNDNMIANNTANGNSQYGVYSDSSSNNTFTNNIVKNNNLGIIISGGELNILTNNLINNSPFGIELYSTSNNTLTNNIINNNQWGIYLLSTSNNTITGGSVYNSNYDYYLSNAGTTNNFTKTNFTATRNIYFNDLTSWFNYQNDSASGIWLMTGTSSKANITRKFINWNNTLIKWNDTFSNATGSITAAYNVTGLLTYTNYSVYNNSVPIGGSPFNSSSNSQINFTINLPANQERAIIINKTS